MQQITSNSSKESLKNNEAQSSKSGDTESTPGLFNADNVSAGAALRIARKNKGMSYEDVGDELNLSNSVLEAIENDAWEHLPEATYVRGYIRAYARLLGLDPADVMMSFRYNNSEQNISLDSMPRGIEEPKLRVKKFPLKLKLLFALLIIAAIIAYSFADDIMQWWETEIVATETNVTNNSSSTASNNNSNDTNNANLAPNTTQQIDSANATTENNVEASASSVGAAAGVLELQFSATSWVDIRDSAGKKVVYKSFPPGETNSVKAALPLNVFIGNADAVIMTYQGRTIDLQQHKEEVYAKFQLTTEMLN